MSATIGLFGSNPGDWRQRCQQRIEAAELNVYDPTNAAWSAINHSNGDQMQPQIDALVAEQHRGMHQSTCVLYNLDACDGENAIPAFAARCELGFLTGAQIPTFAYIDAQVTGRNYLWAQMKPYAHMHVFNNLEGACEAAIAFAKAQRP